MSRMVTICIRKPNKGLHTLDDFRLVPLLQLHGTWRIIDMLPEDQVLKMGAFANSLERRGQR